MLVSLALFAAAGCGALDSCSGHSAAEQPKTPAAPQAAAVEEPKAPKAPPSLAGPSCDACRLQWCANAEGDGVDILHGCYEKPDPKYQPNPDAQFAEQCKAVVECAYKNKCGFDPALGPVECFCGSNRVDECKDIGPAKDAKCVAEWTAATRGKTTMEVLQRFTNIEYPSAWAFHLIECDRDRCGAKSPYGRCTP
jgi:hypothetical protein